MREIVDHYELHYREDERLGKDTGPLEFARTQERILRALPTAPATVLDIGGGPGPYARWLSELGYAVRLGDLVPRHAAHLKNHPAVGKGVQEIRITDESGAFRVVYVARRAKAVYVLHAFQKKTQATSKMDIDTAKRRLAQFMGGTK